MRLLILTATIALAAATTINEQLNKNGIVMDYFGQGRLIREEMHCKPWTMNLFDYVNGLSTETMSNFGKTVLKRKLYQSFTTICKGFEVETDVTENPSSVENITDKFTLRYTDRFEMAWNVQKFERDLRSLFLEHKLNSPFHQLFNKDDLKNFAASDIIDFAHKTTIFPTKCSVPQMVLNTRVCINITEPSMAGPIYAIAHTGQFTNDKQVFVYYDVPSYILIDGNTTTAVDIANCKIMFGSYIYCFSTLPSKCNLTTMENCQMMAVSMKEEHSFERPLGASRIVATTEETYDVYGNGTTVEVPSDIFTSTVTYTTSEDGVDIDEARMTPLYYDVTFPSVLGESIATLSSKPSPVYKLKRKGLLYLTHKPQRPTVWDDVKDFFLHLV